MVKYNALLSEISARFSDHRTQLCDVKLVSFNDQFIAPIRAECWMIPALQIFNHSFQEHFPDMQLDTSRVRILRTPSPCMVYVKTNLTSIACRTFLAGRNAQPEHIRLAARSPRGARALGLCPPVRRLFGMDVPSLPHRNPFPRPDLHRIRAGDPGLRRAKCAKAPFAAG